MGAASGQFWDAPIQLLVDIPASFDEALFIENLVTFERMADARRPHGHRVIGLDGSPRLAAMARANSGCEVLEQSFLELDLPGSHFDGVFANAVLFHIPGQELPRILGELHATLKPGGVLFSSNPRGSGQEGWDGDRYGAFHDWPAWHGHLSGAGFVELTHFYRPRNVPIEQRPWLASVWRKPMS